MKGFKLPNTRRKPTLVEEKALRAEGYVLIAGVDEVGRGSLMGPVVAAAVIMPETIKPRWKSQVRDSKQLSPEEREYLEPYIKQAISGSSIANDVIDSIGIAGDRLAMMAAIKQLLPSPSTCYRFCTP
jgi:ribonuclease HII